MLTTIKIEKHKAYAVIFSAIAYVCWLSIYSIYENKNNVQGFEITLMSWIGILVIAGWIFVWKKLTGELFTTFNVFLAFFSAFNFGQCFLWAVGIHPKNEIGKRLVFDRVAANNQLILQTQLIFIICFITLNCGAMLVWNKKRIKKIIPIRELGNSGDYRYRCLFYTALLLSIVVIPIALYNSFNRFRLGQMYSYSALYNGEAKAMVSNAIINILSSMFFPCLLGLLIGSRYNGFVRVIVYLVFLVFAAFTLLGGDRGEWINILVFLLWSEFHYYKKKSEKSLFILAIIGVLSLSVINAIVSLRNIGLSWDGFIEALTAKETNPIVSLLVEFGHSMGICIILLARGTACPYGNTYLMTFPTIFGTGLGNRILGTDYVQLHTWFPEYLGIRYGTDFSIIGEAVLNCGVYSAPFILLIEGIIIARIAHLPYREKKGPLEMCLSVYAMACIVSIARSTLWLVLNRLIYTIIAFCSIYMIIKLLLHKKNTIKGEYR